MSSVTNGNQVRRNHLRRQSDIMGSLFHSIHSHRTFCPLADILHLRLLQLRDVVFPSHFHMSLQAQMGSILKTLQHSTQKRTTGFRALIPLREELMDRIGSSTQALLRQMATCDLFKLLKRVEAWKERRNCRVFALECQLGLHDLWSSTPLLIVIRSRSRKGGPTRSTAWSK
jgi:hypothetical protein